MALKTQNDFSKKEIALILNEIIPEKYIVKSRSDKNSAINRMVKIENLAVSENSMLTLSQYGVELVKDHLTTISEVKRVCTSD